MGEIIAKKYIVLRPPTIESFFEIGESDDSEEFEGG